MSQVLLGKAGPAQVLRAQGQEWPLSGGIWGTIYPNSLLLTQPTDYSLLGPARPSDPEQAVGVGPATCGHLHLCSQEDLEGPSWALLGGEGEVG